MVLLLSSSWLLDFGPQAPICCVPSFLTGILGQRLVLSLCLFSDTKHPCLSMARSIRGSISVLDLGELVFGAQKGLR
jgi:hypothetical protein